MQAFAVFSCMPRPYRECRCSEFTLIGECRNIVPSIITDLESLDVLESNSNEQDRYRRELSEVMIGVRLCFAIGEAAATVQSH